MLNFVFHCILTCSILHVSFISSLPNTVFPWQPCSQCSGASLPATEINLPGLLPLMPRNAPLRAVNLSGGLQTFMHAGHDMLSSNMEEAQSHYIYKCESSHQISHYTRLHIFIYICYKTTSCNSLKTSNTRRSLFSYLLLIYNR